MLVLLYPDGLKSHEILRIVEIFCLFAKDLVMEKQYFVMLMKRI